MTSRSFLAERLAREIDGEVLFDAATRGRYATDASIYQVMPVGVVIPRTADAAIGAMQLALEQGVAVLPRGAGTSQCGQTVGEALVIDDSKYLDALVELDVDRRSAVVEPGMVLDTLNAKLRPHGLWYPVDVSTAAQATLGGMSGNNSCGSRSLAYGNMVDRVRAIDAWLPTGERGRFGPEADLAHPRMREIAAKARALWERERDEIAARFPKVARRVAGYNLDRLAPDGFNLARLLVGSEGTLAWFERIHLELAEIPRHKALGVAHFPRFHDAMDAAQHIVKLGPSAVELVDRTMLDLALGNAQFAPVIRRFVRGEPDAILLVEFAGPEAGAQAQGVRRLEELMGDLGFPGAVVTMLEANDQKSLWDVRKAGLNIMMSMKGDGKPVSFIEDCAVPLEHLAEYTSQLTEVFRRHGTEGTWYAHASVGCLHVRPVLNMKGDGAMRMRAIAAEAADLVRRYKGSYSGEHGDGLVRSEWIAPFFGPRLTACLGEIKSWFDPKGLMNPGKIVNPPKQDDRSLFRYKPGYTAQPPQPALDWKPWGGFAGAVEMCNNNGHCRKLDAGTMCPSYRATGNERDLTRGRANTLRLAMSGQLGTPDVADAAVREALDLCVSCKGCKRECPTGVDMARMKIEFLAHDRRRNGCSMHDRLVGHLPRYAAWAARLQPLADVILKVPGADAIVEALGFDRRRPLPRFCKPWVRGQARHAGAEGGREIVLLADTFSNALEPHNLDAASAVLAATGHRVVTPVGADGRALCCGRTYLAVGLVDHARAEALRTLDALAPYLERGVPVVGLEPSCTFTFRDEYRALFPDDARVARLARAMLADEYLAQEVREGRVTPAWRKPQVGAVRVHGHCHQKAFDTFNATLALLGTVPGAEVSAIESSCCGMAGAFGHEKGHYEASMAMGELSLLPAVRAAAGATIVAAGTSCRQQIADGAQREALHPLAFLARGL
ncbi:MAG TPA: FAD-linked oxidase C-terminal domain-containing protein [Usitatibacter sp.]|jgi:FAD/FMN-containing dehydrogenase/Fe-S oxidoreductase|nr:FAD-linked oxidase C-terminal domain-containing protein [Usitatibacter sp.]